MKNYNTVIKVIIDPVSIAPDTVKDRVAIYSNELFDFFARINFFLWIIIYSLTIVLNDLQKINFNDWLFLRLLTLGTIILLFLIYLLLGRKIQYLGPLLVYCLGLTICFSYCWSHHLGYPLPREYIIIIPFLIYASVFRSYLLAVSALSLTILLTYPQWTQFTYAAWVFTDLEISFFLLFFSALLHRLLIENKINYFLISDSQSAQRTLEMRTKHFATNLAHDIRSPLAALNALEPDFQTLPESTRQMAKMAVSRIRDIANNLLLTERPASTASSASVLASQEPQQSVVLSTLIDPIISEKRIKLGKSTQIEFHFQVDELNYSLASLMFPTDFRRVLSNLLDNAIEAISQKGVISVSLLRSNAYARLSIVDTGKGIPQNVLNSIGTRGLSVGKSDGFGLGLSSAKEIIASWNGHFAIESELDHGTRVHIDIPLASPPAWFTTEIQVNNESVFVTIDDDPSVHQIWRTRISRLPQSNSPRLLHLSSINELEQFLNKDVTSKASSLHYFIDQAFNQGPESGLQAIERLHLSSMSTLVTSHFEEQKIQEECIRLGIKAIPKTLLAFVPILYKSVR